MNDIGQNLAKRTVCILTLTTLLFTSCVQNEEKKMSTVLDSYGGWSGMVLSKTGFFHTEHDGERWWFVTPEGNVFLSFGINHYHAGWWAQEYNREHWNEIFGAQEVGDQAWGEGFRKVASADMDRLGINTLGWHTDAPTLTDQPHGALVPYLRSYKPIILDHYLNPSDEAFVDVFSPEFERICDETARRAAGPYVDDPMLLGYCMSDCPIFTDNDIQYMSGTTSWSRILRNLGQDAPGKQAYVAAMKERYPEISTFNAFYGTSFNTWTDLEIAENWRPNAPPANMNEREDNEAFTLLCVDRYYEVSKTALRKVDPHHLFLGDKLNGNTDNLEKVLEVAARYVDVIVYQFYGSLEKQTALLDSLVQRVDLPFMNGDIGFSVATEMMPNPHGPHAKDQAERAEWLIESCLSCFSRPEFIGWHMCGIIDTWKTMPTKEYAQHQGLMTIKGEFYTEMEDGVREISSSMYGYARSDSEE